MSTATKDYPSASLRVSDADRDRAIAELSEHFEAERTVVLAPGDQPPPPACPGRPGTATRPVGAGPGRARASSRAGLDQLTIIFRINEDKRTVEIHSIRHRRHAYRT